MKELKNIFITSSNKTPQVDFNCFTGDLILSGRSIPENANQLYEPLLKWVNEYVQSPRQNTNFRINLEYFNTASSIWLARIVKALSRIKDPENMLLIHLYFNVEEFDNMETEDVKDALSLIVDIVSTATLSIGVKIYGTDEKGEVIKESMVLL
jgi:hypothetical protein